MASSLNNLLPECPVCLESLTVNHKVLNCQHTFCVSCLETLHDEAEGYVRCPECRSLTFTKYVASLPNNIILMRIFESVDESHKTKDVLESSSDEEICGPRKKILKPKRQFKKIRRPVDSSDEDPIIEDSDISDNEKKNNPISDDSDKDSECSNTMHVSQNIQMKVEDRASDSMCNDQPSVSNASDSMCNNQPSISNEVRTNYDSGSETDEYYDVSKDTETNNVSNTFTNTTPEHRKDFPEDKSGRSSERIKRKREKSFEMPSKKKVFDSIQSYQSKTGKSPIKSARRKLQPLKNDFTKERNSYNYDHNWTDEDSEEDFIDDGVSSETESSCSTRSSRTSCSNMEVKKTNKTKRVKRHFDSDESDREQLSDDEIFKRKEFKSERAKKLVQQKAQEKASKFNALVEKRKKKL